MYNEIDSFFLSSSSKFYSRWLHQFILFALARIGGLIYYFDLILFSFIDFTVIFFDYITDFSISN